MEFTVSTATPSSITDRCFEVHILLVAHRSYRFPMYYGTAYTLILGTHTKTRWLDVNDGDHAHTDDDCEINSDHKDGDDRPCTPRRRRRRPTNRDDQPIETTNRGRGRELTSLFITLSQLDHAPKDRCRLSTRYGYLQCNVEQSRKFLGSATFPPIWESTDQPINKVQMAF